MYLKIKKSISLLKQKIKFSQNKPLKWVLYLLSGLLLFLIILLLVVYFVLKSGSLTEKTVMSVKPVLKPFGIELNQLDSLRIDLFNSVTVENLALIWLDDTQGKINITLDNFTMKYDLSELMDSKITISSLKLANLVVDGDLKLSSTREDKEDEPAEPIDFSELEELIDSPPMRVDVNKIELQDIGLNLSLQQDDIKVLFKNKINAINASVSVNNNDISANYLVDLKDKDGELSINFLLDDRPTLLSLNPKFNLQGKLGVVSEQGKFQLHPTEIKNQIALGQVSINEVSKTPSIVMDGFDFSTRTVLDARESEMPGLSGLFPLLIKNDLRMGWDKLSLDDFNYDVNQVGLVSENEVAINADVKINTDFEIVDDFDVRFDNESRIKHIALKLDKDSLESKALNILTSIMMQGHKLPGNLSLVTQTNIDVKADDVEYKSAVDKISIGLSPNVSADIVGKINVNDDFSDQSIEKAIQFSSVDIKNDINLSNINIVGRTPKKPTTLLQANNIDVSSKINKQNTDVMLKSIVKAKDIKPDGFKRPVSLEKKLEISTDTDLQKLTSNLSIKIDKTQFFTTQLELSNQGKLANVDYSLEVLMPRKLSQVIPDLAQVYEFGRYRVEKNGQLKLPHNQKSILAVDFEKLDQLWPQSTGKIKISQVTAPVDKRALLKAPLHVEYNATKSKVNTVSLNVFTEGVKVEPLLSFLPVSFKTNAAFDWPLTNLSTQSDAKFGNDSILSYDLKLKNRRHKLSVDGAVSIYAKSKWKKYLSEFSELEKVGDLSILTDIDLTLGHNKNSFLDVDWEKLSPLTADVALTTRLSQSDAPENALIFLNKALEIRPTIHWQLQSTQASVGFDVKSLHIPETAKVTLGGDFTVKADHGLSPDAIDAQLDIASGDVKLAGLVEADTTNNKSPQLIYSSIDDLVTPVSFSLKADGLTGNAIQLDNLSLKVGRPLFELTSTGSASVDGKNAQFDSNISITPWDKILTAPEFSGSGQMALPISFSMIEGRQVSLSGAIEFDNLHLNYDGNVVQQIVGNIAFEEEFTLDKDVLKYAYIKQANPFQRVDFSRIQPFLNAPALSIEKIITPDLEAGPIQTNISIQQNLVNLQKFNVNLFDGHVAGQFYLDTAPGAWKLGLLSRMTGVDLRKMFPNNTFIQSTEYSPVNLRVAFVFDIHQKLVEGRIDVGQIKRDQLLQLIEFIDPEHVDTQLASVRSALAIAHPEEVVIQMQKGLMDLEVGITALPKPIKVSGIPLSVMLQQFSEDILAIEKDFPVH